MCGPVASTGGCRVDCVAVHARRGWRRGHVPGGHPRRRPAAHHQGHARLLRRRTAAATAQGGLADERLRRSTCAPRWSPAVAIGLLGGARRADPRFAADAGPAQVRREARARAVGTNVAIDVCVSVAGVIGTPRAGRLGAACHRLGRLDSGRRLGGAPHRPAVGGSAAAGHRRDPRRRGPRDRRPGDRLTKRIETWCVARTRWGTALSCRSSCHETALRAADRSVRTHPGRAPSLRRAPQGRCGGRAQGAEGGGGGARPPGGDRLPPPRRGLAAGSEEGRGRDTGTHLQAVRAASSAAGHRAQTLRFSSSSPAPTGILARNRPRVHRKT